MHEIKFRVWDVNFREMCFDTYLMDEDYLNIVRYNVKPDQHKIMQYTGLKDKNGTEIYEGDILQRNDNSIAVVEFENGMFVTKYDALMWELCENSPIVIGNIYQNPELLE